METDLAEFWRSLIKRKIVSTENFILYEEWMPIMDRWYPFTINQRIGLSLSNIRDCSVNFSALYKVALPLNRQMALQQVCLTKYL